MSKVLVTGANGFIGSHLVEKFLNEGHDVYGLVRPTSDLTLISDMEVSLRYGDITDYSSVEKALYDIDIVVHNAGLASDWGSLELFRKINLEGTRNVAEAAMAGGISRIVYMSSTAIHGFNHSSPQSENDKKNPVFNYGVSKLEAENWIMDFGDKNGIEVTSIRPGNVFGPGDHTFIEKYMKALASGKIAYVNSGLSLTCPTYVENLVHGVYLASVHEKAPGHAFIITDGLQINWKQFTEAIADEMHLPYPKLSIPLGVSLVLASFTEKTYKLFRSGHAPLMTKYRMYNGGTDYHFSIQKAKDIIGYEPVTGLKEAIEKTVLWFREGH
ncbi:MAG: SDR family NAD(P)-dependent oxidoreductase [Candidatus Fermentibacteria bacterium]|nr:SDR family NAD(P)-dependent oxidoreductase [Candidatus Fermentibacteria bacterium]